jgi:dipeptidyl-peptidase-3
VEAEHQAEIACAEYEAFARNALVQLRRVREGTTLEEDHMRNRQLVVRWLMKQTHAVQERWRDGKTFYVVADVHGFHEGVGRLLAEVQRIKSRGDFAAAKALVDTYGTHFDPALRDEIVARVQRVDLPSYTGFVMPHLEPVHGPDGRICNVRMNYPLDFTVQMLDYAAQTAR